jgi:hypothetical protein
MWLISMGSEYFGVLDRNDPVQVSEYEHQFYLAYAALTDNTLVRLIWDWDDASQRLRTKIRYDDQVIYAWRDSDHRLVGAMAVNIDVGREFQGERFGFTAQGGSAGFEDERSCEVLNVMSTRHSRRWTLSGYHSFIRAFGYGDLIARGFDVAYSTCTRRRLRPYLRLGAKLLNQGSIGGEERFFLSWPIRELGAESQHGTGGRSTAMTIATG